MSELMNGAPYVIWAIGIAVIAVVLVAALMINRRKTPAEDRVTDRATAKLYREEQAEPENR